MSKKGNIKRNNIQMSIIALRDIINKLEADNIHLQYELEVHRKRIRSARKGEGVNPTILLLAHQMEELDKNVASNLDDLRSEKVKTKILRKKIGIARSKLDSFCLKNKPKENEIADIETTVNQYSYLMRDFFRPPDFPEKYEDLVNIHISNQLDLVVSEKYTDLVNKLHQYPIEFNKLDRNTKLEVCRLVQDSISHLKCIIKEYESLQRRESLNNDIVRVRSAMKQCVNDYTMLRLSIERFQFNI